MSLTSWFRFPITRSETTSPIEPVSVGIPTDGNSPVDRMSTATAIADGRYVGLLTESDSQEFDSRSVEKAWAALRKQMALVPGGIVRLGPPPGTAPTGNGFDLDEGYLAPDQSVDTMVEVESFYVDRHAVTNAEFHRFVRSGGYQELDLWPRELWAIVLQLSDQTGQPGPRFWSHGQPPKGLGDHPVVGVSWYEATAYAHWIGKCLPSSAQWQRAGTWHSQDSDDDRVARYPWGNSFDPQRANTMAARHGSTQPVARYSCGATPNGIYQLIGNTWEWVSTRVDANGWDHPSGDCDHLYAEIRGGAFDTYLESQATCQFRSAQKCLFRGSNVGFRCCVIASALRTNDP